MVEVLNNDNFETSVSEGLVLVDFFAEWCGPCQMQMPIIEEFAEETPDVHVYKVDIDESAKLAEKYSVMSIPTLIVFKDGEVKDAEVGVHNKLQLASLVGNYR